MANSQELLLRAKARRRRAEAEGVGAPGVVAERPAAFEAASEASSQLQGGPGVEPPANDNWLDYVLNRFAVTGDVAKQGLHGAATGIENVLGLPGDLMDLVPNSQSIPMLGQLPSSQDIHSLSTLGGLLPEREEPEGWLETIVNRLGEELGATAIPAGGIAAAAVQKGLPAVRAAGGATRFFLEPAAVNLPNFLGKEAAGATAAGLGAGTANLMVDRDTTGGQWADLLGALGGVGVASIGEGVMRSLGDVIAGATGNKQFASQIVRENVADTIINNSDVLSSQVDPTAPGTPIDTTELVELLNRTAPAETVIPGYQASTADRAGDFGLASLEDVRSRGANVARFRARQEGNTEAIDTQLNTSAPTEQPGAIFDALETQRGAQLGVAEQDVAAAIEAVQRALSPLEVGTTPAARGSAVRSGLMEAREGARSRTEAAYDAADTDGNMVDPAQLAATLDGATANLTQAELSHIPEALLNRVRALGVAEDGATPAPVDLREATTLLSEIKELRRAAVNEGRRNANRVLGGLADTLDDFITANVTPEQRVALDQARAAKFDEAERFARPGDPVTAALDVYPGGRPKMRDEQVARSFASRDASLGRLFDEADTPEVRTAIREEMLDRLDAKDVPSIERFMGTYSEQIDRFPGLSDELRTAAAARADESAARTTQSELEKVIGTQGKGPVAQFLRHSPEQAEKAMQNVLNSGRPGSTIDELLRFVGDDPKAVEGARAAFWRVMERKGRSRNAAFETKDGVEPWMPKKWRSFLEEPNVSAVMERLYQDSPEHLSNIREIAEALRTVNTGGKAGAAINPSGSAQTLRNGPVTLAEAQAKFIDVQRGRLNPLYAITYLAGKMAHRLVSKQAERAYQRLLDEALLNPKIAAELLRDNNPANRQALKRNLSLWLGNEASHLIELLDEDGEDKKAPIEITVPYGDKDG